MTIYVMTSADFPNTDAAQRQKIHQCLENKLWHKVQNIGTDISSVWWAKFDNINDYEEAFQDTIKDFTNCSKPYSEPVLALQTGFAKPVFHNCLKDETSNKPR